MITWHNAPVKTTYGAGMKIADISLDKDSTLRISCHEDDLHKVDKAFRREYLQGMVDRRQTITEHETKELERLKE